MTQRARCLKHVPAFASVHGRCVTPSVFDVVFLCSIKHIVSYCMMVSSVCVIVGTALHHRTPFAPQGSQLTCFDAFTQTCCQHMLSHVDCLPAEHESGGARPVVVAARMCTLVMRCKDLQSSSLLVNSRAVALGIYLQPNLQGLGALQCRQSLLINMSHTCISLICASHTTSPQHATPMLVNGGSPWAGF